MGNTILNAGITGLNAAQVALTTIGHNISNANTVGYHRQEIVQSSNLPLSMGFGYIGQGVQIDSVKRDYSAFLDKQVMQAVTQSNQLQSYSAQISQLDTMLADATAGLSPSLQTFFSGVQDVAANPASIPSRQVMLSDAQALVSRFQTLSQRFTEIHDGVNTQVADSVGLINSYAKQIAELNQKIALAQNGTDGQPPNDLLDQRDQVVAQLNQEVKASVVKQSDGSLSVFVGNGQALVIGTQTLSLQTVTAPDDPSKLTVGWTFGGNTVPLSEASFQGGKLGGLLAFRSETLDTAQNALGRVAIGLAKTFNDQHALGQDLNGNYGKNNFFTFGSGLSPIASPKVISNLNNSGSSTITASITDVGALTTSDYRFSFDGTNYKLTRLSDGSSMSMTSAPSVNAPLTMDGVAVTAATINQGESFLIQPTREGANDIRVNPSIGTAEIAVAAPILASAVAGNTGTGTISAGVVNSFNDKVTFTFTSGTKFDVVDVTTGATLAKNMTYSAGSNISFNGWTVQVSGVPATGNVFTVDKTLTSTTSTTATIAPAVATLSSPPVDPFLKNTVQVVFDSATTYHLAGATNNVTGASTIVGGAVAPTQGNVLGSLGPASLTITTGANDTLNVTVDGVSATVTIPNNGGVAYASEGALMTAVQTAINTNATIAAAGKSVTLSQPSGAGTPFKITSNSFGSSSAVKITGGNGATNLMGAAPVATVGANPVGTASSGAVTIGTGGAGSYTSTGVKTTITGGTVTGTGPFTLTGATITVEGGSYAGATTFSGLTVTISAAGDISIPALGATGTASTFNGRPATGLTYNPTGTNLISANGWNVQLTGAPATGDTFTIGANASGVADSRNGLLLAGLQTKNTLAGNTTTYQGAYSQLVNQVGDKAREINVTSAAQDTLVSQTKQAQQSLSGVNLDEEAANMMRYQQAYQASGKMIQIASQLFATLLSVAGTAPAA